MPGPSQEPHLRMLTSQAATALVWKLIYYPQIGRRQLFNLKDDPEQLKDLSSDNPEVMKELRQTMLEYLDELDTDEVWMKKWRKD